MELKTRIAEWIRGARTSAGLSGSELGVKLALELGELRGNTRANISHWETCKHEPSLQQIIAIVKITGRGLPADVIAAMAGNQATLSSAAGSNIQTISQIPRASFTEGIEGVQAEVESISDSEPSAEITRLERLNKYETDLVTATRECRTVERELILANAKSLIPDKATVHKLFPSRHNP